MSDAELLKWLNDTFKARDGEHMVAFHKKGDPFKAWAWTSTDREELAETVVEAEWFNGFMYRFGALDAVPARITGMAQEFNRKLRFDGKEEVLLILEAVGNSAFSNRYESRVEAEGNRACTVRVVDPKLVAGTVRRSLGTQQFNLRRA